MPFDPVSYRTTIPPPQRIHVQIEIVQAQKPHGYRFGTLTLLLLLFLVLLFGCGAKAQGVDPALSAANRFDGVYTGKRVLTKGSGPTCPSGDDVSVTIHGRALTFTNSALRDFPLSFDPYRDGSFGEIYTDIGGAYVLVHGRIVGDVLDADVTSSACEHHWHLKRGQ
jgi:hypothetical protein